MMVGWEGGTARKLTTALSQGVTSVPVCKGENGRRSEMKSSMESKRFVDRCVLSALIIQEIQPTMWAEQDSGIG